MNPHDLFAQLASINIYARVGLLIAVIVYIPMLWHVWSGKLVQNFATYMLWGLLDIIAAGSTYLFDPKASWVLPGVYALLSFGMMGGIIFTGTFKWTWVETMTASLVVICMVIWTQVGNTEATIASTIAVVLASGPLFWDSWKEPLEAPLYGYMGFTLANGVSTMAGKDWSIAERFYPGVCTLITALFVVMVLLRRLYITMRALRTLEWNE